jgi:hypothetical protein
MMSPRLDAIVYSDRWRTAQMVVLALLFGWLAFDPHLNLIERWPGPQADLHSASVLCWRATLGYWIARICLGRIERHTTRDDVLARAFVIGMCLVSFK